MKRSLLDIVQEILSSMSSDEVNSISDTVESNQVALICKRAYYDCATDLELPEHETLFKLEQTTDLTKPVMMTLPANVLRVNWIKYDNQDINDQSDTYPNYKDVEFLEFTDFLTRQQALRELTSGIGSMNFEPDNGESFEIIYKTDTMPIFYTCVDDFTLLFDGYDSDVDTTNLLKSKTMCHGILYPEFLLEDDFVPDFDPNQFSYYVNRCNVKAWAELKDTANQEAAGEARRQKVVSQKNNRDMPKEPFIFSLPRYGRRGSTRTPMIEKRLKQGS